MVTFKVLAVLWAALLSELCYIRWRRVRTSGLALGLLCLITVLAVVLMFETASLAWLGLIMGAGLALGWTLSGRGTGLTAAAGGVTFGLALYQEAWQVVVGAVAGLVLGGGILRGLYDERLASGRGRVPPYRLQAFLCRGEACQLRGADLLREAALTRPGWRGRAGVRVTSSACLGHCEEGPLVLLEPAGILHSRVRLGDLDELLKDGGGVRHED